MWGPRLRHRLEVYRIRSYRDAVPAVFLPDGKQLASAAEDKVVLWNTATGERLHRLRGYGDTITIIVFLPDGKQLASVAKEAVILWNTATGEGLHRLLSSEDTITAVFSPDGKQLAWVTKDKVILWDTATGGRLHRFRRYGDSVAAIFSPDGRRLSSISTNPATSSTAAVSVLPKVTPSRTNKLPYNLDDTKDMENIDFLHEAEKPMAQVRNSLSYVGGGPHTVNIYVD